MNKVTKAYLAVAFLSIAWGTTYLAIRIAVMHYPAFLFAGLRQVIGGALLGGIALLLNRKADLSKEMLLHNIFVGFLLITMGNGIVSYAEKYIPSGVAALICCLMPLNAVVLNLMIYKNERMNKYIIVGLALAILGVVLIFRDNIADLVNPAYFWGMIATYFATISWAYGSIRNRYREAKVNPLFNSAVQLFFGGVILVILSPAIDSYENFEPFQPDALKAMAYLIIVGSLLAYSFYMYAFKILPVGVVTLYAYINPLVAVLLGYLILDERLTWYTGIAFVTIVSGVYLVNTGYRKEKRKAVPLEKYSKQ